MCTIKIVYFNILSLFDPFELVIEDSASDFSYTTCPFCSSFISSLSFFCCYNIYDKKLEYK